MKPDDFLKCKKVRCVKAHHNNLTVGKEYSVLNIRIRVEVIDDAGSKYYWRANHFEPVLDSAENQLQDVELTPEFEAGNKVYKYGETDVKTVLEVFEDGYMRISNYPYRVNHELLCHATPENHAVLSKPFPAIEFEQPHKELKGSDLARALIKKGWVGFNCLCGHIGDEHAITETIVIGINDDGKFITFDGRLFDNAIPMNGWRPLKAQEVGL